MMKAVLLSLALLFSNVYAHTTLTTVVINGVPTNDCVRPINMGYYTYPMQSGDEYTNGLTSSNYTCGFMPFASQEAPSTCVANAGDTISVGWGNSVEVDTYPILIENHKGPIIIYMAKHNHGSGGFPQGNAWFKVFQVGLTRKMTSSDQWDKAPWAAPYTLYENQGTVQLFKDISWAKGTYKYGAQPFQIPADLPAGDYLIRTELISLHANSPSSGPNAQLYVGCAQIRLQSGGNGNPTDLVSFPGAYALNIPAFNYVPWRDQVDVPYPFPGPSVYVASATPPAPTPVTPAPTPAPTDAPTPAPVTPVTPQTPAPVPPPPQDTILEFYWTSRGVKSGSCIQITEPQEPVSWTDNYLCALNYDIATEWVWTNNGTEWIDDAHDFNWIQWAEPQDPNGWDNNYLGIPKDDRVLTTYAFSANGRIPAMTCTRLRESMSSGWNNNYWCTAASGNGIVNVGVNGVYNGPADESEDSASSASVLVQSLFALVACFALLF